MECRKQSFAVISVLFGVFLSFSTGTLMARDADLSSPTLAAAHTANHRCINSCRARDRDCHKLSQIPIFECQGVYQDCMRYTCNARPAGRPVW
jgi:hypothetical protein